MRAKEESRQRKRFLQRVMFMASAMLIMFFTLWATGKYYVLSMSRFDELTPTSFQFLLDVFPWLVFGSIILILVFIFLREANVIGTSWEKKLNESAASIDDLNYIARTVTSDVLLSRDAGVEFFLRHWNCQFRYAGVIASSPDKDLKALIHGFDIERISIVRRAIAQKIAAGPFMEHFKPLDIASLPAEAAYLVEAAAERGLITSDWQTALPNHLVTLAALSKKPDTEFKLKATSESTLTVALLTNYGSAEDIRPIQILFNESFERGLTPALSRISPDSVRKAIRELSPFEDKGLGTFDELHCLAKIDQYYLFFRGLLFFIERGLIPREESK
jgi:hypothetical protein